MPSCRQLASDAQRPVPALGVQGHVLLRIAFVVDEAALAELRDDAARRVAGS